MFILIVYYMNNVILFDTKNINIDFFLQYNI